MSDRVRYMRLIVFFDLPVSTARERRIYSRFRRYLVNNGFLMMQYSVYSKLAINERVATGIINRLRLNAPEEGVVQVLQVTEKQFSSIELIAGNERPSEAIATTETLVVL
jgi:CRISPR-associated protein Cas2